MGISVDRKGDEFHFMDNFNRFVLLVRGEIGTLFINPYATQLVHQVFKLNYVFNLLLFYSQLGFRKYLLYKCKWRKRFQPIHSIVQVSIQFTFIDR